MTRLPALVGQRDDRGRALAPLSADVERTSAPGTRRRVLAVLADAAAGGRGERGRGGRRSWPGGRRGAAASAPTWSTAVLREAETLGLTGRGALTSYGRRAGRRRRARPGRRAAGRPAAAAGGPRAGAGRPDRGRARAAGERPGPGDGAGRGRRVGRRGDRLPGHRGDRAAGAGRRAGGRRAARAVPVAVPDAGAAGADVPGRRRGPAARRAAGRRRAAATCAATTRRCWPRWSPTGGWSRCGCAGSRRPWWSAGARRGPGARGAARRRLRAGGRVGRGRGADHPAGRARGRRRGSGCPGPVEPPAVGDAQLAELVRAIRAGDRAAQRAARRAPPRAGRARGDHRDHARPAPGRGPGQPGGAARLRERAGHGVPADRRAGLGERRLPARLRPPAGRDAHLRAAPDHRGVRAAGRRAPRGRPLKPQHAKVSARDTDHPRLEACLLDPFQQVATWDETTALRWATGLDERAADPPAPSPAPSVPRR